MMAAACNATGQWMPAIPDCIGSVLSTFTTLHIFFMLKFVKLFEPNIFLMRTITFNLFVLLLS